MTLILQILFELMGELAFEGAYNGVLTRKFPKWIRYPLALGLLLIVIAVPSFFVILGVNLILSDNLLGIILVLVGAALCFAIPYAVKRDYLAKKSQRSSVRED